MYGQHLITNEWKNHYERHEKAPIQSGFDLFWTFALGLIVTAGVGHAAGTVVGWGFNGYGQTTAPSGLSNVVAISAGDIHSLALTAEGQVVAWGNDAGGRTMVPAGLSNVVAIAAGGFHSLALTADDRVVAWGGVSATDGLSNVMAIAAGYRHSLALTADDRVVDLGNNASGSGLSNVGAIAAGGSHTLALTADGRVVGWGANASGQTTVPSGLSNVVAIAAAGGYSDSGHSLALTVDGQVVAWGDNTFGQATAPSGLSNVVAIAAGGEHSLALMADGTVAAWGRYWNGITYLPVSVPAGLSNVVAIAAGGNHNLAIKGDAPLTITVQPVSQSAIAGRTVTFHARAVGMPPLQYQWQKDGTNLPGQTKAWLALSDVTPGQTGNYALIVSNFAVRAKTSSVATLTVNCLLNVAATAGGSVTRSPDLPVYAAGSLVTLDAMPAAGYGFIRWSGDATGSTNPLTVIMDTNKNITAVFASVALTVATQGLGSVTKVPDQALYAVGEQVTLIATPERLHQFAGWSDGATNNPRLVTIGESNRYKAVFTAITPLEPGTMPAQTGPVLEARMYAGITVTGTVSGTYTIEATTNLSDTNGWTTLATVVLTNSPWLFVDTNSPGMARRYYRAVRTNSDAYANAPVGMVWIAPATFTMGSPTSEADRSTNEVQHTVTISQGFWMAKYEVTQGEYQAVMGINPSSFTGDLQRPVEQVSWYAATNYCGMLTAREKVEGRLPEGWVYRLPTEAEWEYACRAGTATATAYGNSLSSIQANFVGNYPYGIAVVGPSFGKPIAVGSYAPNAWGLYDMHGNVLEWCSDLYGPYPGGSVTDPMGPDSGSYRVVRGGSWNVYGRYCRSAVRAYGSPDNRDRGNGFRVVLAPGQ